MRGDVSIQNVSNIIMNNIDGIFRNNGYILKKLVFKKN